MTRDRGSGTGAGAGAGASGRRLGAALRRRSSSRMRRSLIAASSSTPVPGDRLGVLATTGMRPTRYTSTARFRGRSWWVRLPSDPGGGPGRRALSRTCLARRRRSGPMPRPYSTPSRSIRITDDSEYSKSQSPAAKRALFGFTCSGTFLRSTVVVTDGHARSRSASTASPRRPRTTDSRPRTAMAPTATSFGSASTRTTIIAASPCLVYLWR